MRYAGIIKNDVVNGEGVCLSVFTQGCPHRCKGCFNSETWNFDGGIEIENLDNFINKIIMDIKANGIIRNLSILGGEPLCPENQLFVFSLIKAVKANYPNIKIFLWTGYYIEDIILNDYTIFILQNIDMMIDGPFVEEERDITLKLRGSKNQRILTKDKISDIIKIKGEYKYV